MGSFSVSTKSKYVFSWDVKIGARPINLHLKGFEALGAIVTERENQYIIEVDELIGNNIYLDIASVGKHKT